jgi:hypothetical protein
VVNGSGLTVAEEDGKVLPADRMTPPFVFDDPVVLNTRDLVSSIVVDQRNRVSVFQLDV